MSIPSVHREDFVLLDGPPCAAGQPCPDFSAWGVPIRIGAMIEAEIDRALPAGSAAVTRFAHGLDNWKATVWRR